MVYGLKTEPSDLCLVGAVRATPLSAIGNDPNWADYKCEQG